MPIPNRPRKGLWLLKNTLFPDRLGKNEALVADGVPSIWTDRYLYLFTMLYFGPSHKTGAAQGFDGSIKVD